MNKKQIFNQVQISLPKRNQFDLSHDRKFSMNMGFVYPTLCEEVYPNESWTIGGQSLVRTAPMVAPIMHQVNVIKHYWHCPNRLLWANWDTFITGGDKYNSEAPVPNAPYITVPLGGFDVGSIADYLGFPTDAGDYTRVSAFPFAAYLRVHQEYYRNQALQDTDLVMLTDGDNTTLLNGYGAINGSPFAYNYEKDYFTSCLPEPQKGPEVTIPLGDTAPIHYSYGGAGRTTARDANTDDPINGTGTAVQVADNQGRLQDENTDPLNIDISTTHYVDLSTASSGTVNSWRLAVAMQSFYEKLSRGGSRTMEFLRNVWGARPNDARLDRPEYICGSYEPLSISEVLQTSETAETPQGNLAGHAVAVSNINRSTYHTQEYGIILGFMIVVPKTAYMQGVRRAWTRLEDRFDYYFPDLAHIGEQPVRNDEIFLSTNTGQNKDTFGYLPYGTELRYINDSVHGEFRTTQDHWHMGRIFENLPALNEEFVTAHDVTRRVFADLSSDTDTLYCHLYHNIRAKRCVPLYGTPSKL